MFLITKKGTRPPSNRHLVAEMICGKSTGHNVLTLIQVLNGIGSDVFRFSPLRAPLRRAIYTLISPTPWTFLHLQSIICGTSAKKKRNCFARSVL
jgi:hypothetical protein